MRQTVLLWLVGLQLTACQGETAEATPFAESCIAVGDAVVSDLDWAPASDDLAVLLSWQDGMVSVGRLTPADGPITELARFLEVAPASVAIGPDQAVYWQRSDNGTTQLFRQRPGQDAEVWIVPGVGFAALEATLAGMIGATVVEIGAEADVLELVDIDLRPDGTAITRKRATVPGLQSISVSPDGSTLALSALPSIGGAAEVSVSGSTSWSASVEDTSGARIALNPDGSAVMFVQSSTGSAMLIHQDGTVTASALGTREVLAFDIAPSGLIAAGSRNITGGPGSICFIEG